MSAFEIKVGVETRDDPDAPQRVSVVAGGVGLTRALREGARQEENAALVPPERLAFWLVDNWWRLRWECVPAEGMHADWRLAHDVAGIGGGFVWPRMTIWGEGDRVGLLTRSDPVGVVGPVRYLAAEPPLAYIRAGDFEAGVDAFLVAVVDASRGYGSDRMALRALIDALGAERADRDVAAWRRMEARLGYDPDDAPEALIEQLARLAGGFGARGVEEAAAAAPGREAGEILAAEIEAARSSRVVCELDWAASRARPVPQAWRGTPWAKAERAAGELRRRAAIPGGPIRNKILADITQTKPGNLNSAPDTRALPYGLRLAEGPRGESRVSMRGRWSHDRRFEVARALGDAVWAGSERLGPIASSRTDRQKFQRAFAQSLLCPYADLVEFLDTEDPTDGDLAEAARHFHVSERVVRTVLVNKRGISRDRLHPSAWQDSDRLHEALESA